VILFVILLPLAFGLLVNAAPLAVDYSRSILAVRESLISGDIERALEALESALEYSPWRGDLWQQTGRLYMESGELDTALTAFEEAQALGQLDPQGQVWLADMLISNGYGDAAKHVLVNIDDRDPFILEHLLGFGDLRTVAVFGEDTNDRNTSHLGEFEITDIMPRYADDRS